jgi:hypothetical protein
MPWLYNATRDVHPVELADGTAYGFLPRKKVFVALSNMSAAVWRLIQVGKLANQGGDPVVVAPITLPQAPAPDVVIGQVHPEKLDTSSSHHQSDGRVAVDSSSALDGKKESKAVKKQDDDLEKAPSGGPEVISQSNDTSKKTEKRSGSSRKRT